MYKTIFSIGVLLFISHGLKAQFITPVKKDSYPLREIVKEEIRSASGNLIKERGFNPYAVQLKSVKGIADHSVQKSHSAEELNAGFIASGGNGYYFESFEDAYGSRLPNEWSNHPSAANSRNIIFHWQAFSPRVKGNPDPQNRTVMSIEGLLAGEIFFDEMFQSSEIEIHPNSQLVFNVGFAPIYLCEVDFEKGTYNPAVNNSDLEVSITTDNGKNYTPVFSLYEASKEDVNFQEMGYRSYSADLSAYAGKKVRLAFRYTGMGVARMDIDNISIIRAERQEITIPALYNAKLMPVCNDADHYEWSFVGTDIPKSEEQFPVISFKEGDRASITLKVKRGSDTQMYTQEVIVTNPLPAIASYKHPDGVYLVNTHQSNIKPGGYLAPTDVKFNFINRSLFSETYNWDMGEGTILTNNLNTSAPEVVSYLSSSTQPCPTLEASNSTLDSVYAHSGNLYLGGNYLVWNIEDTINGQNGKAMQGLGSNSAYKFEGISEHFSKPLKEQFIEAALLHFVIAQSNTDFSLTATIRGLESGKELGKSVLPKSKATSDGGYGVFFTFNFSSLIKVSEAFGIEITGIPNGTDDKLFLVNQYFGINGGKPFEDNTAYFKMNEQWISACDIVGYATSLSISPLIISPVKDIYLKDESNGHYKPYNSDRLELSTSAGVLDMGIIATSRIKGKPVINADWIRCTSLSVQGNQHMLVFNYDTKSEGDRQATIHLVDSLGTTKDFIVYQGRYSSIQTPTEAATSVVRNGHNVQIRDLLSSDSQVMVYDICGRTVFNRPISVEETSIEFNIPHSSAVYLIRIEGDKPRSFKL